MIDVKLTGILLFLVPGLCAFGALYQLFGTFHLGRGANTVAGVGTSKSDRRKRSMVPVPPPANSIKAIILVLLWSLVTHMVTTSVIAIAHFSYDRGFGVTVPEWLIDDPYAAVLTMNGASPVSTMAQLLLGAVLQGVASILLVQRWLRARSRVKDFPYWLYGWTAEIADAFDDDSRVVVVVAVTTTDIEPGKVLAYTGMLRDLTLKPDGSICVVSLQACERYIIDLTKPSNSKSRNLDSLSNFPDFTIDGAQIRNLTIEKIPVDKLALRTAAPPGAAIGTMTATTPPSRDRVAVGLARLYAAGSPLQA